jgi:hypothetical protein
MMKRAAAVVALMLAVCAAWGASGDPQVKTDHPWYPGELSCSTFERLFRTQSEVYARVTGRKTDTDEDKALAAWFWRNLNYAHGEEGAAERRIRSLSPRWNSFSGTAAGAAWASAATTVSRFS